VPSTGSFTVKAESPTTKSRITVSGTKEAGTVVYVNEKLANGAPESTAWSLEIDLVLGENNILFSEVDSEDNIKAVITKTIIRLGQGDIDGDGKVTIRDIITIFFNFGPITESSSASQRLSDLNNDGKVDFADIFIALSSRNQKFTYPVPTTLPGETRTVPPIPVPSSSGSLPTPRGSAQGTGGKFSGISANQTVSGKINVTYTVPQTGISSIEFYVDNVLVNTERVPPFALGGDNRGILNGYDTSTLSEGPHTIKVVVRYQDGRVVEDSVQFNVRRAGPNGNTPRPSGQR
jgi:hypothetical protein